MQAGPWKEDKHGDLVSHYPNGVVAGVVWTHGWWIQGPDAKPEDGALADEVYAAPRSSWRRDRRIGAAFAQDVMFGYGLAGDPRESVKIIWRQP